MLRGADRTPCPVSGAEPDGPYPNPACPARSPSARPVSGGRVSRRNIGRLVLVAWIVALGWLAQRELFQGEASTLLAGAARLPPDARYFRVDAGPLQIGVLNVTWDTLPTGFRIDELLAVDLPDGGSLRRQFARTEMTTSRALTLQEARRTYANGPFSEVVTLSIPHDSAVGFGIQARDQPLTGRGRIRTAGRATLAQLIPLRLAYGGRLIPGESVELEVADLPRQRVARVAARVMGDSTFIMPDSVDVDSISHGWITQRLDTVRAWRIEVGSPGAADHWWVDNLGRLVRLETPFGVTLQRIAFEYSHLAYRDSLRLTGPAPRQALSGARRLAGSGIVLDTAVQVARYTLSRIDRPLSAGAVAALAGGAQAAEGTTLVVRRTWPSAAGAAPPAEREPSLTRQEPTERHRAIVDTAAAGARSARDTVVALTRWVFRSVAMDTSLTANATPFAVERQRTGGPAGMARLLMDLGWAAGYTSRMVSGLAITPQGALAHVWTEFWVGGDWVPVDPAHGHAPASARLVRIVTGGEGRPLDTLLRTAALRVEPTIVDRP